MDQPHHRTDDSDGRRVAAHALVDLGGAQVAALLGIEINLENAADHLRLGAVDQQLQAFARVRIGLGLGDGLEAEQPLLACRVAPGGHHENAARQIDARRKEDPAADAHRPHEHRDRRLQQHRAQRTAQHDQCCRSVEQRRDMAALEKVAPDNGDERKQQPDKAEYVHQMQASARLRPMSSRPYTASLRLAFTTAIGMP